MNVMLVRCQVWKAKDPETEDIVALKMIKATDKESHSCVGVATCHNYALANLLALTFPPPLFSFTLTYVGVL